MFGKRKVAMMLAEFVGTGALTLVVLSVAKSTIGIPYFVAVAAGLMVALMVLAVGAVSGAHLNPALTLGLWTARKITTLRAITYIAMQLLGAYGAYWLYRYLVNNLHGSWPNTGHFTARVMVAEAVGAFVFAFGWMAAARQKFEAGRFAAAAGLALVVGMIIASAGSNGFINPAVALGARSWGWGTYVLGPVVGAVVGVNLYSMLFADSSKPAVAVATASRAVTVKPAAKKRPVAKKKK